MRTQQCHPGVLTDKENAHLGLVSKWRACRPHGRDRTGYTGEGSLVGWVASQHVAGDGRQAGSPRLLGRAQGIPRRGGAIWQRHGVGAPGMHWGLHLLTWMYNAPMTAHLMLL